VSSTKKNGLPANMRDIARLAGVSIATVSRALQNNPLVSTETRDAILEVAAKHGYVVNRNARKLRQRKSNTIAAVVDFQSLPGGRISEPFHFQMLADLAVALGKRDQDLLLCSPSVDQQHSYQLMLASKGADGVIFFGQGGREPFFRELTEAGAAFVVWGAPAKGQPYCCIGSDNTDGGRQAAAHFIARGRKRPLFIGLGDEHLEMRHRYEGFARKFETLRPGSQVQRLLLPNLLFTTAVAAITEWLDRTRQLPDAVFAASDTIGLAMLSVLQRRGVRVPEAVSIVGFDDVVQASYSTPTLSSIRQDTALATELLVQSLLSAIDGGAPKRATVPVELVVRET
jgi:DNA-binding LacI/PurR family transcriptional regulator